MTRHGRHEARQAPGAGGTPATVELAQARVEFSRHEYDHDPGQSAYGLEAAQSLGLPAASVFKTLLVALQDGNDASPRLGVVIVPVDRHVDLKTAAAAFGAKRACMADPKAAQRSTGYVLGGISPFGQSRRLPTVLDASAAEHETMYVSGGRRGFDIGLAPADLLRVLEAVVAPISR